MVRLAKVLSYSIAIYVKRLVTESECSRDLVMVAEKRIRVIAYSIIMLPTLRTQPTPPSAPHEQ